MVYVCRKCGRVFKSWRSYIAHILIGKESGRTGSASRNSRSRRVKAIKRRYRAK